MAVSKRILIAEDEAAIRRRVLESLCDEGHDAHGVEDGRSALKRLESESFDLVILDGHLPGVDGFKVLETLRTRGMQMPVLMLTARAGEGDRLLGFHLGADDYLVKPFYMSELVARIKVLLARKVTPPKRTQARLKSGNLVLDTFRMVAILNGQPLDLLNKEAKLLEAFMSHPGEDLSRDQLMELAWERDARPSQRTVDAQVARLRKRLGDGESWLATLSGIGYRWVRPVETLED